MSEILHGSLPDTEYFEITARSGTSFGVWVTTPPGYAVTTDSLPLIYLVDGNWAVGLTAPLIVTQSDPYLTIAPYIQVSIGYAGDEAAAWAHLRNRDLVPPGEPVSKEMVAAVTAARESGAMTQQQADDYLAELADTHADVFLEFISDELHPHLQERWRVADSGHGLFGFSYGGLFSLYAWLRQAGPFATFGAGTPGVASPDSQIFALIDELPEDAEATKQQQLHVTLNELEVFGDVPIYRELSRNVLTALEALHAKGQGPNITRAMMNETHVTGLQASFLSYLKTCHSR